VVSANRAKTRYLNQEGKASRAARVLDEVLGADALDARR